MSLVRINWNPGLKELRQFGITMLVGFGLIGLLLGWKLGSFSGDSGWTGPSVIWGLGILFALTGFLAPPFLKPIYLIWMGLAFPMGWLMSHVFLVLVYFGIFTPVALFFRLVGRDVLRRRSRTEVESHWIPRMSRPEARRYFRQF